MTPPYACSQHRKSCFTLSSPPRLYRARSLSNRRLSRAADTSVQADSLGSPTPASKPTLLLSCIPHRSPTCVLLHPETVSSRLAGTACSACGTPLYSTRTRYLLTWWKNASAARNADASMVVPESTTGRSARGAQRPHQPRLPSHLYTLRPTLQRIPMTRISAHVTLMLEYILARYRAAKSHSLHSPCRRHIRCSLRRRIGRSTCSICACRRLYLQRDSGIRHCRLHYRHIRRTGFVWRAVVPMG